MKEHQYAGESFPGTSISAKTPQRQQHAIGKERGGEGGDETGGGRAVDRRTRRRKTASVGQGEGRQEEEEEEKEKGYCEDEDEDDDGEDTDRGDISEDEEEQLKQNHDNKADGHRGGSKRKSIRVFLSLVFIHSIRTQPVVTVYIHRSRLPYIALSSRQWVSSAPCLFFTPVKRLPCFQVAALLFYCILPMRRWCKRSESDGM